MGVEDNPLNDTIVGYIWSRRTTNPSFEKKTLKLKLKWSRHSRKLKIHFAKVYLFPSMFGVSTRSFTSRISRFKRYQIESIIRFTVEQHRDQEFCSMMMMMMVVVMMVVVMISLFTAFA